MNVQPLMEKKVAKSDLAGFNLNSRASAKISIPGCAKAPSLKIKHTQQAEQGKAL